MEISFRALEAEDVEARVGQCSEKGCTLLLYKDSRCDMRILDEAVGPMNWQRRHEFKDGKPYCSVGIRDTDTGEWVWKEDVGAPSNMEAEKGEASDSFKRACVNWGIGRELYTAPRIWVDAGKCTIKPGRNGRPQCWDRFIVGEMSVEDGRIAGLTVLNASRRNLCVYGAPSGGGGAQEQPDALAQAKNRLMRAIEGCAERNGMDAEGMKAGISKRPDYGANKDDPGWFEAVAEEFEGA